MRFIIWNLFYVNIFDLNWLSFRPIICIVLNVVLEVLTFNFYLYLGETFLKI